MNSLFAKLLPAHAAIAAELEQAGFTNSEPDTSRQRLECAGVPSSHSQPALSSAPESQWRSIVRCGKCGSELVECPGPTHHNGLRCPTCTAFSHPVPAGAEAGSLIENRGRPDSGSKIENPIVGVTAVIRDSRGRFLLGQKNRACSAELVGKWVTPGGRVNHGESLEAAIIREVKEETSIEVLVSGVHLPQELFAEGQHFVFIVFECRWRHTPEASPVAVAGDDLSDVRWFTFSEIGALATAEQLSPMTVRILNSVRFHINLSTHL